MGVYNLNQCLEMWLADRDILVVFRKVLREDIWVKIPHWDLHQHSFLINDFRVYL